jgi:glucokinase
MYLAGDIGGTKTLLGEFEFGEEGLIARRQAAFASQSFSSLEPIVREFLDGRQGPSLQSACFGVAGTVVDGHCHLTNVNWDLDEQELAASIGVERVKLLNDLEATAYGMVALPAAELSVLNPGASGPPGRSGTIGVIAAGTGLGEAMLFWDGEEHQPIASEGGHADFGPRTEREVELWHFLRQTYGGHVSYERVLSGPGFSNIYTFLRDRAGMPEPAWLSEKLKKGDRNAVIAAHGLAGDVPLCAQTVQMFASIYGAEAGNLALRYVTVGGVYLGGGIAPKLLPALRSAAFLDSFVDKGRFADFLRGIEVSVALNPRAALLGAANYARRL